MEVITLSGFKEVRQIVVRERGLEPLCLAAVDFEPTTSTDSVTLAAGPSLPAKRLAEKATQD
ncbi:hypothetical protein AA14362_2205 [Acetobacter cerevisiae DSM 14362]|nr:hypothetical protein AA14362_2205 [Acetobacter cerevisiae DSM 14362]